MLVVVVGVAASVVVVDVTSVSLLVNDRHLVQDGICEDGRRVRGG